MAPRERHRGGGSAAAELLVRLDRAFAPQHGRLSVAQVASIRAWQRTDRAYEVVQRMVRDEAEGLSRGDLRAALAMHRHLSEAIATARLPFPARVYRGVRSTKDAFGADTPVEVVGQRYTLEGYFATSIFREVAVREFTTSEGALMEVALPSGLPALWVAGVGSPSLRRQGELLLDDGLQIRLHGTRREQGLRVLSVEAIG